MNLEKVREAAERVARSEGLEVVDVEWKVGKQRFLRVTIDRVPPKREAEAEGSEVTGSVPDASQTNGGVGPGVEEGRGFRAICRAVGEDFDGGSGWRREIF